ncbi:DUF4468 domain-containing protein [Flavobacterium sp. 102]|uniref:DUF4468 domain-containing protein n=1 Tax=Flavobacterium sp. 102 TaxID=2135623 RepID=UPI000EB4A183|nr:DUF4468 domain-containing protein [Flavobacterium sp. 102]RKS00466.1 uncharacterized protein with TBP-like fold DUF4468 [Flavobacterium sp. 102]
MKKLFLLLICTSAFSQDKFELTPEKFTDYVVCNFEGKTEIDLYIKSMQWLEVTYKNPKEVLKGNIENDYIRFTGSKSNLYCINALGRTCYDVRYTIELVFKDGKIKFDVIDLEYLAPSSQYSAGGWSSLPLMTNPGAFFKKGELKKTYKYIPEIADHLNSLKSDLQTFITTDAVASKKEGW